MAIRIDSQSVSAQKLVGTEKDPPLQDSISVRGNGADIYASNVTCYKSGVR